MGRKVDRYLAVEAWARARWSYLNARGERCWLAVGLRGVPGRVARVEDLAAVRYLGCRERWPNVGLRDCPTK